jgi:purine-binding chemotaxis protein CheW
MSAARATGDAAPTPSAFGTMTLLVFRLDARSLALPVERVHALLDPPPATAVPGAPAIAPALVNVRGTIVPLVDLRRRLGLAPAVRSAESRLVVVETAAGDETLRLAMEADAVEGVVEADRAGVVAVPEIGSRCPPEAIAGALARPSGLVLLLDPESVFAPPSTVAGTPGTFFPREGTRP